MAFLVSRVSSLIFPMDVPVRKGFGMRTGFHVQERAVLGVVDLFAFPCLSTLLPSS